jgi:integrase
MSHLKWQFVKLNLQIQSYILMKRGLDMQQNEYRGWKFELQQLIDLHNHLRIDSKPASLKMQSERAKYLFKFMEDLRKMGYMVEPSNIKQKHIQAICEKYESDGLAASTIMTYISFLRALCHWIKKPGMINDVTQYFSSKDVTFRQYAAVKDKSWDKPEIDKYAILQKIRLESPFVYIQLLLEDAFGLRRKESIMFRPHMCDKGEFIVITEGTKGGRPRVIQIETEYQREVLNQAKYLAKSRHAHVSDPELSLKQNLKKFSNTMTKFRIMKSGINSLGVTAHGLRSGYAIRQMEQRGIVPSVKGGEVKQKMTEEDNDLWRDISEMLGHSRPQIVNAYTGPSTTQGLQNVEKQIAIQDEKEKS